jgi:leucyl-tRNA synthetase
MPIVSRGIVGRKSEPLDPEAKLAVLSAAAWLLERKFDPEVRVVAATEAPEDVAGRAEPGRPAIDIAE